LYVQVQPAAFPPITRDHLLVLWQEGRPHQHSPLSGNAPVPLTQTALYTRAAFIEPTSAPDAVMMNTTQLATSSDAFKRQALEAANRLVDPMIRLYLRSPI